MKIIKIAINTVSVIFGMFGGFLLNMAPSHDNFLLVVGLSALSAFFFYLLTKALTYVLKNRNWRIITIIFAVLFFCSFIFCSYKYYNFYDEYVFNDHGVSYVGCGNNLDKVTEETRQEIKDKENPIDSPEAKILSIPIDKINEVWPKKYLSECRMDLNVWYYSSVSFFFLGVSFLRT